MYGLFPQFSSALRPATGGALEQARGPALPPLAQVPAAAVAPAPGWAAGFGPILAALEGFVAGLEPSRYGPDEVAAELRRLAKAEKLCATATMLLGARAARLHAAEEEGTTSTAKLLAGEAGTGVGSARRQLDTALRLSGKPELDAALRAGEVSPTQAAVMLAALEADPGAAGHLLDTARREPLSQLRQEAQRIEAARRSEEEAEGRLERLRARRHLRFGLSGEGAVVVRGELPPLEGAAVRSALEHLASEVFHEARREGRREPHEAYLADALARLCARAGSGGEAPRPRAEIVLHVSVEALRRGRLEPGERCEIEGVGPVPLSTLEDLFPSSWVKLIVTRGHDVAAITKLGRALPAPLEAALKGRDQVCCVPGCGITWGLEIDHLTPLAEGGPTELANLARLCRRHHYLKTHQGWRLLGSPGNWSWVNERRRSAAGGPAADDAAGADDDAGGPEAADDAAAGAGAERGP